jgi:hypothetical protein
VEISFFPTPPGIIYSRLLGIPVNQWWWRKADTKYIVCNIAVFSCAGLGNVY